MQDFICHKDTVVTDCAETVAHRSTISSPLHLSIFANQAELSWLQSSTGDWYHFIEENIPSKQAEYIWVVCNTSTANQVSGYRLANDVLESTVKQFTEIEDVLVIGLPDEQKGNAIHVFATLKNTSVDESALTLALTAKFSALFGDFAKPTAITFVDQLPDKSTKKSMRQHMKSQLISLQRAA